MFQKGADPERSDPSETRPRAGASVFREFGHQFSANLLQLIQKLKLDAALMLGPTLIFGLGARGEAPRIAFCGYIHESAAFAACRGVGHIAALSNEDFGVIDNPRCRPVLAVIAVYNVVEERAETQRFVAVWKLRGNVVFGR